MSTCETLCWYCGEATSCFQKGSAPKSLPVLFAGRHIVEACRRTRGWAYGLPARDACIEDGIEAESLEERDLTALVKHLYFIDEIFFRRSFVAAEFVNSFGAWSL